MGMITMRGPGGVTFAMAKGDYSSGNGLLTVPEELEGMAQRAGFRRLTAGELAELGAQEAATVDAALPEAHPQAEATAAVGAAPQAEDAAVVVEDAAAAETHDDTGTTTVADPSTAGME